MSHFATLAFSLLRLFLSFSYSYTQITAKQFSVSNSFDARESKVLRVSFCGKQVYFLLTASQLHCKWQESIFMTHTPKMKFNSSTYVYWCVWVAVVVATAVAVSLLQLFASLSLSLSLSLWPLLSKGKRNFTSGPESFVICHRTRKG